MPVEEYGENVDYLLDCHKNESDANNDYYKWAEFFFTTTTLTIHSSLQPLSPCFIG